MTGIFPLLFSEQPFSFAINLLSLCYLLWWGRPSLKSIMVSIGMSFLLALPYAAMLFLYTSPEHTMSPLTAYLRVVFISLNSMIGGLSLDFSRLFAFLMTKKIITPTFGYTLNIAIRSLAELKEEVLRLKLIARLRGITGWQTLHLWLPLFIFSIRHSQRGALSLLARGINNSKTFYFADDYAWQKKDYINLIIYLFTVVILLLTF